MMRPSTPSNTSLALLFCTMIVGTANAELRLPAVFGDHMVLQRETALPVWGWADADATVTVSLDEQEATTQADADGRWRVDLDAMPAGGPYELSVRAGSDEQTFSDVMLGEVWVCSGQSNMDMRLQKIWDDPKIEQDLQREGIRLFRVERATEPTPQDNLDGRWALCEPGEARSFSAVAYFMGATLQRQLGVTVGLIHTAYGGTPAEAWTAQNRLAENPELVSTLESWDRRVTAYESEIAAYETAVAAGDQKVEKPADLPVRYAPGGLFNAMVHPLIPYAVKGAVWYQGESNVWRATQYRPLLATLIDDWRERWGQDEFAFGVVQLPNYENPPRVPPGIFSWAELRESQLRVSQDLEKVGLAVTIDIGDPTDIHPVDKEPVGHRLALWALADAYQQDVVYSGPLFTGHEIVDDKVILSFDHVGSGLEARDGRQLKGFVIAGPDRKFRWANAVIDGEQIIVTEAKVPHPQAVRYAWADNPYWANLINREGLPASPFRTDDWESVTQGSE